MKTSYLRDYAALPLYNIKAVVQMTDISPSTLRAWERRYQICQPQRLANGYRLYSDRDIALIQWLKAQVDTGMAVSQAVAWLESLEKEAGGLENVALPGSSSNGREQRMGLIAKPLSLRNYVSLQQELLEALLHFNEHTAALVLAEAFNLYPIELVGENLLTPLLVDIGERWERGEASVTNEHYATSYIQQRLLAFLHMIPNPQQGGLIWVGCPSQEQHELGAILLTLYLRRAGYPVQYIGKNLPVEDFVAEVQKQQPALILLSASTVLPMDELQRLTAALASIMPVAPQIGYGGRVFKQNPALKARITGMYMGDSALEAVKNINHVVLNTPRKNSI